MLRDSTAVVAATRGATGPPGAAGSESCAPTAGVPELGVVAGLRLRPPNRYHRPRMEPEDPAEFTRHWNAFYTAAARPYDLAVRFLPVWKRWLSRALPHIQGPRVLEASFGTGYLLTRYASRFDVHGIDFNPAMIRVATRNLRRVGKQAALVQADVEALPYRDGSFDSVVNTMAFSGYPNGRLALGELKRVLRVGGRLILIDVGQPADGNRLGAKLVAFAKRSGDIVRDMGELFEGFDLEATDEAIGGAGSIHLWVATHTG